MLEWTSWTTPSVFITPRPQSQGNASGTDENASQFRTAEACPILPPIFNFRVSSAGFPAHLQPRHIKVDEDAMINPPSKCSAPH